jgi:hypothetical protein
MLPHRTKKKIASEGVSIPLTFSGRKNERDERQRTQQLSDLSRATQQSLFCAFVDQHSVLQRLLVCFYHIGPFLSDWST